MQVLDVRSDDAAVAVAPGEGGRLAKLEVGGVPLIVARDRSDPMGWGCYPMVPWAGRVRDATFHFDGRRYELPANLAVHSAHGVGFTSAWSVVEETITAVVIELTMGDPWPFGGEVRQSFDLGPDRLSIGMSVTATQPMPVMVGWHPWFPKRLWTEAGRVPVEAEVRFGRPPMYERDPAGIPTGRLVPCPPGPWDDCFTDLPADPVIRWPGVIELTLTSSCDHWVVFDEPALTVCVEPQSGAPDEFNRRPTVLAPGETVDHWFEIGWQRL